MGESADSNAYSQGGRGRERGKTWKKIYKCITIFSLHLHTFIIYENLIKLWFILYPIMIKNSKLIICDENETKGKNIPCKEID